MKNADYDTRDVKKQCENKLEINFNKPKRSDHYNGWFWFRNKKTARITIAKGRKPIPPKTYKSMAKQLKLTIKEFDDLLDCPLNKDKYEKILSEL